MTKTADTIITWIEETVASGTNIPTSKWIDAAFSLNALVDTENAKYADLYRDAHKIQWEVIEEGESAAKGEAKMKASEDYRNLLYQKARLEQIAEFIRIAKIRSQEY